MAHDKAKPIRREVRKSLPVWRIPDDGPVIPRLKQGALRDAIGFRWSPPKEEDESWQD